MATLREYQDLLGQLEALRAQLIDQLAPTLISQPEAAQAVTRQLDDDLADFVDDDRGNAPPPDGGLAGLIGVGSGAGADALDAFVPPPIAEYDEAVTSERLIAVGDLYYIYQHERIGVLRAMLKLQELFRAGTVRLSDGPGALGLYRFDRRQVLRHARRDRLQAYRRVFGYTRIVPSAGAQPNDAFHGMFVLFMTRVAQYFRDKRISEVIRPRVTDASFGSVAVVRRAGLDLRSNLKRASYGHVNVLRVELMQLLEDAFRTLGSPDVRQLFGADNAWDVVEIVLERHAGTREVNASQRGRMAIAGRNVIRWLAQPHVLNTDRTEFEGLLDAVADDVEEWLTSAEALGIATPRPRRSFGVPSASMSPAAAPAREAAWNG